MQAKYNSIKRKQILRIVVILAALFMIGSLFLSGLKVESYEDKVLKYREQKDEHFHKSIQSPIPDKENFHALSYFEPDSKYKVKASLEFVKDTQLIGMPRNDGKLAYYEAFAVASFKIDSRLYALTLYRLPHEEGRPMLFLPFYDKTNGSTTYGGGRYLDLDMTNNRTLDIDFNYAYNPFCVYNYQYTCPVPPRSNYLDLEIKAGEKTYEKK